MNIDTTNSIVLSETGKSDFFENYNVISLQNFCDQEAKNVIIEYKNPIEAINLLEKKAKIHLYNFYLIEQTTPLMLTRYRTRVEILFERLKAKIGNKKDVIIFGTAEAGSIAYKFCQYFDFHVQCFIDDYKSGFFKDTNIEIINRDGLKFRDIDNVGLIIIGPNQKGLNQKMLYNIDVFHISDIFTGN